MNPPETKYNRKIMTMEGVLGTVDVYRVLSAFNIVEPELQHALKKLLCMGIRDKGSVYQDFSEAVLSLQKMKERLVQTGEWKK